MKRILVLIKGLGRGGAEQIIANATPYLDRRRFTYEVAYLLARKNALVPRLDAAGIPVHCLKATKGPRWILDLRTLLRRRRIDLIHAHLPYAAFGARLAVGLSRSCRVVYTEHNVWPCYRRATYWANALTFPRNDHVFAVSEEVRASIRYPSVIRALRMPLVETLYHGVDPSTSAVNDPSSVRAELGIPDRALVVGTVGNFRPEKAHMHLLEAAARVRKREPDTRFVLVGQGPLAPKLRRRAEELGLDGSVIFAGPRADAQRVMSAFDVFVLSSIYEGLSIALIEAMALGKPAVVTRAGGVPEVVEHGTHGLVVPPARPEALADSILSLLHDEPLRSRMGAQALRRAADFDIRNAVRRMEQVYEELLS